MRRSIEQLESKLLRHYFARSSLAVYPTVAQAHAQAQNPILTRTTGCFYQPPSLQLGQAKAGTGKTILVVVVGVVV